MSLKCRDRPPLRYVATIQKLKTTGQDASNQLDKTSASNWETYCSGRRCYVRDAGSRERFSDDITVATVNKVVGMWADPLTRNIKASYRLQYTDVDGNTRTLQITGVKVSDDTKFVTLQCWEDGD